jgi:hypothetical protein
MPYTLLPDEIIDDARTTNAARHLGPNGIGRAVAVLVESFSYANRNLTDGAIDPLVARYFKTDRRPIDVLTALAFPLPSREAGWLAPAGSGWQIVDWSRQLTRATVLARRDADRRRKAASRTPAPATVQPALVEIAAATVAALPTAAVRDLVAGGARADILETIKGIAARANLPYTRGGIDRAIETVRRRVRHG